MNSICNQTGIRTQGAHNLRTELSLGVERTLEYAYYSAGIQNDEKTNKPDICATMQFGFYLYSYQRIYTIAGLALL